jgi:hypothetical protein
LSTQTKPSKNNNLSNFLGILLYNKKGNYMLFTLNHKDGFLEYDAKLFNFPDYNSAKKKMDKIVDHDGRVITNFKELQKKEFWLQLGILSDGFLAKTIELNGEMDIKTPGNHSYGHTYLITPKQTVFGLITRRK